MEYSLEDIYKVLEVIGEDAFVIKEEVTYNLKSCLEGLEEEVLNIIYAFICIELDLKSKDLNRDNIIKFLEENIPLYFKEYLSNNIKAKEIELLDKSLIKNEIYDINKDFTLYGFMYTFKDKYAIIPNELLDIYKEYKKTNKKKELDLSKLSTVLVSLLEMNGIMPIDLLKDIVINKYHYDISSKDIDSFCEKEGIDIYKDKYYALGKVTDEINDLFDIIEKIKLVNIKNDYDYKVLSEEEVFKYDSFVNNFIDEIGPFFIKNKDFPIYILYMIAFKYENAISEIEEMVDALKIKVKNKEELFKVIDKYKDDIKIWIFNGRSINDVKKEEFIRSNKLIKEPKDNKLNSYLDSIDKNKYKELLENYKVKNKEKLVDAILKEAEEIIESLDIFDVSLLVKYNGKSFKDIKELKPIAYFFIFNYRDKVYIPFEYLTLLAKKVGNSLIKTDDKEDLVLDYIEINGVLEKKKLKELLKEYHDIDLSIKELDKIVDNLELCYKTSDYYYIWEDAKLKDLENFMILKRSFNQYAKVDKDKIEKTIEFEGKMYELDDDEDLIDNLIFHAKSLGLTEDLIKLLREDGYDIGKKLERNVLELYKSYKKDIFSWAYNGYTIAEYYDIKSRKIEKIGRNDKCPCGSGKKYKNCCGK